MANNKLCVIAGDGIGPEVTTSAVRILQTATSNVEVVYADAGWKTFCECGDSVPGETFELIRECGAALFGAVSSPARKVEGYRSSILRIRQTLDLFASLRPVKSSWANLPSDNVDLVVVRENSEGLYSGREQRNGDRAVAEKVVTKLASERIASMAGKVAIKEGRSRISIVHKANVLPVSDGLFRNAAIEVLKNDFPEIEINEGLADIVAHNLVAQPQDFEVLVTTNMFGDILSDIAAHWCGGMGRAPSLNFGDEFAVAEPVHGSAPDIAGQGVADPAATILSLALLCRYQWNDDGLANRLEQATIKAIAATDHQSFRTTEFTEKVIDNLQPVDCAAT